MEDPIPTPPTVLPALPVTSTLPIEQVAAEVTALSASPGYKTTEFWMHACIIMALILGALCGFLDARWAAICATAAASFYAVARGLAKQGNSH